MGHQSMYLLEKGSPKPQDPETCCFFTPLVGVLFSPMMSGRAGGWWEDVYQGCISETVRCRKLILGRDTG